jgi:hypothetical protein
MSNAVNRESIEKLTLTRFAGNVYYEFMVLPVYQQLRATARRVAAALPKPAFYERHANFIQQANETLATHELVRRCRSYLDESQMECAHGLFHCEAVARDAGALILIEMTERGTNWQETEPLFLAAIIAGLLHDIKRREEDHAFRGSIEAEKILTGLGMNLKERQYIADAIRNHEAFQETFDRDDDAGRLVSDALYDADKFRWGPENFTTTLWLIVETRNTPLELLHRTFREKMKGIEKIKETFRTSTGKQYGPEFIDQGIAIGNVIFSELSSMLFSEKEG